MPKALWIVPLLALAACTEKETPPDAPEQNTAAKATFYRTEIAPILQGSCATCHLTGAEAGNMALIPDKAVSTLVGVKSVGAPQFTRVIAGDPDNSYLIMKLEGTHSAKGGFGATMPFGAAPLSPEKIAKIRKWIAEGAKE